MLCLVTAVAAFSARAHDPGLSTGQFRVRADRIESELTFARLDIESIAQLDTNGDGKVSPDELAAAQAKLAQIARDALSIKIDDKPVAPESPKFRLDETNNFHLTAVFPAKKPKQLSIHSALVKQMPRGHRQFVSLHDEKGETLAEVLLSADQDVIEVDMEKLFAEETRPGRGGLFHDFLVMGVKHILTGYDHLLFLFGLLIVMSQFRATIWVITCFTLAHSTTLALAAFDIVRVSGRVVEPLIAATIMYVGVENLLRPDGPKRRWLLTLIFGLVHGLGFATDLKEKLADVTRADIVVPLISFNLGVELGQMCLAAIALPAIWQLRKHPVFVRRCVPACSVVVVSLGAWWLLQRTLL